MEFKKWLLGEVGGSVWEMPPKQNPIDPEHPERSALPSVNFNGDDKPPAKKKFGKEKWK